MSESPEGSVSGSERYAKAMTWVMLNTLDQERLNVRLYEDERDLLVELLGLCR